MPQRHSKNDNDLAFFTYDEKKKLGYGTQRERLGRDSVKPFDACCLCLKPFIYHRDLKPENLLLDENGDLKVSDFGLSAVSDEIRQDGHRTVPHFKGNDELGLVQAKWSFVNKDENLLTRLQNINLSFHFEVEQQVNSVFINFFGFNESPAVEEKEKPSAKIKPDLHATKTASFCSSLLPLDIKFEDVCCDHYCSGLCIRLSWLESQPSETFSGE